MANENARKIPLTAIFDLPGVILPERSDKSYGGLVSSIQAAGLKEPVILRLREDGKYQLLHGYRRKRACELAKQKEIAAEVYDMTEAEARSYRQKVQALPTAPIPGKQLTEQQEKELLEKRAKEKAASAAVPTAKTDDKAKSATPEKPADPKAAPAASPAAKPDEKPKSATPDGQEKDEKPKSATPDKPTDPKAAPASGEKKPGAPEKPADPKAAPAAAPTARPDEKPKSATPDGPKKDEKPKSATQEKATGPAGTGITQVLVARDKAPTEQDLKSLPVPKEGESLFVTLHPDYLEKSELNIFSVDRKSENYRELYKSIQSMGIKDPVLARPGKNGKLEIISGQRRHDIAKALGCPVPTFIQQISDEDAKILVADGNLHRDKISSYDLSRALRMKMEAMKQKAGRRKKGQGPSKYTDEVLAEEMGVSTAKFNRILRLSEATQEVCNLYDSGKLELSIVSNLSYLQPENQKTAVVLYNSGYPMSTTAVDRMKKAEKNRALTVDTMRAIMNGTYEFPAEKRAREEKEAQEAAARAEAEKAKQELPPSPDVPANASAATPAAPAENGAPSTPAVSAGSAPAPAPTSDEDIFKGEQERPEVLKVVLAGDRLRKYYPDVSMTPREIEEDIYGKLERCRQIDEKQKAKEQLFKKGGTAR